MASVFELAKLSSMVYDNTKITFQNWVRKRRFGIPTGKAFYAELYFHTEKKEAAYVIRGTDLNSDWSDYLANLQIGIGQVPHQFAEAERNYRTVKKLADERFLGDYKLYFSGHSLGGGLASLLSAKQGGLPAVTFNAPGMMHSYAASHGLYPLGLYKLSKLDVSKILHIRATGDPISLATGKHMGRMEEVYVDEWGDGRILGTSRHLAQHSIKNMVNTLAKHSQYRKDLA